MWLGLTLYLVMMRYDLSFKNSITAWCWIEQRLLFLLDVNGDKNWDVFVVFFVVVIVSVFVIIAVNDVVVVVIVVCDSLLMKFMSLFCNDMTSLAFSSHSCLLRSILSLLLSHTHTHTHSPSHSLSHSRIATMLGH